MPPLNLSTNLSSERRARGLQIVAQLGQNAIIELAAPNRKELCLAVLEMEAKQQQRACLILNGQSLPRLTQIETTAGELRLPEAANIRHRPEFRVNAAAENAKSSSANVFPIRKRNQQRPMIIITQAQAAGNEWQTAFAAMVDRVRASPIEVRQSVPQYLFLTEGHRILEACLYARTAYFYI